MNSHNKYDFLDNLKKYNTNSTSTIFVDNTNNEKQNIKI